MHFMASPHNTAAQFCSNLNLLIFFIRREEQRGRQPVAGQPAGPRLPAGKAEPVRLVAAGQGRGRAALPGRGPRRDHRPRAGQVPGDLHGEAGGWLNCKLHEKSFKTVGFKSRYMD